MTTNERFKKQVRARMARTGEKYGAARRALLSRIPEPITHDTVDGRMWVSQPEQPDDSVREHTGRSWNEWCDLIEAGPADDHQSAAKWLMAEHDLDGWWSQAVTIGWERITGQRLPGQLTDGTFASNSSKTMPGDAAALRALLIDDEGRADLFLGVDSELRSKPETKVIRLGMEAGTALISLDDKGDGRMRVGVQHTGLADPAARENWADYWKAWLDDLADASAD